MRAVRAAIGTSLALLLVAAPVGATSGGTCDAGGAGGSGGSVALVVLASPERVAGYAATVEGVKVLRRDAHTVVFADGRVITSDVAAAGQHLNALGWGGRRVQIVASFPSRAPRRPG
jgi:hypothetical protein